MQINILPSANDDLLNSYDFYEKQKDGFGIYIVDTLYSDIESLTIYAGIHPLFYNYHCMLSKRFPFAIYYKIKHDVAYIYTILDCRKNPLWIKKKLL